MTSRGKTHDRAEFFQTLRESLHQFDARKLALLQPRVEIREEPLDTGLLQEFVGRFQRRSGWVPSSCFHE